MRRHAVRSPHAASRGGFSLVEMLVATTLVVLMMLMFAQIYTAAIRSVSDQQAIARNDQRARSVDQVLRNDLLRTSFREVPGSRGIVPLVNGDAVHSRQKGYFYISENDRDNPLDDVLQFTMFVAPDSRSKDNTPFYGRCQGGGDLSNTLNNHPDADDGIEGNDIGLSRGAEVVYFVRNGNLYRHVLLLRDPALDSSQLGAQPGAAAGTPYVWNIPAGTASFHRRFDYSAYYQPVNGALPATVRFLGLDALDNYGDTSSISLGRSRYRFGFRYNDDAATANPTIETGYPVEYDDPNPANNGPFFGRLTHAETTHTSNQWPGNSLNPIEVAGLNLNTATNRLQLGATALHDTARANEDLLLNNVEAFDIQVWDPLRAEFIQLGQSFPLPVPRTYFAELNRLNRYYGPKTYTPPAAPGDPEPASENWVFDTGHPADRTMGPTVWQKQFMPPFRPLRYPFSEDSNFNGSIDPGEDLNGNGVLNRPSYEDNNRNGLLDLGEDQNGNGVLDYSPYRVGGRQYDSGAIVFRPGDVTFSIGYRAIRSGEDLNGNNILDAGEDTIPMGGNGTLDYGMASSSTIAWPITAGTQIQDGGVIWEAFDNRIGLESIRVTVRTRDTATGNPRQITIIHSFVEPPVGQ